MYLIDVYRHERGLVLWYKPDHTRIVEFRARFFIDDTPATRRALSRMHYPIQPFERSLCTGEIRDVLRIEVAPMLFEKAVRDIERATHHRAQLYDADIPPEQQFLYANNLSPLCEIEGSIVKDVHPAISLSTMHLEIMPKKNVCKHTVEIERITIDERVLEGKEEDILREFIAEFERIDPDAIMASHAFSRIPYLIARMETHGLTCRFHRFHPLPIQSRGGRSFYSYGQVRYNDFAIRLHGRFLVDTNSSLGGSCSIDGLIELSQLCGTCLQQVASRSPGAVFQNSLVRELWRDGALIPFKEKPLDAPLSMSTLVKADRAGQTLDPKSGFHRDVAEIDFVSMFPWLMYLRNISAERLLSEEPPHQEVPGLPLRISIAKKGYVPRALLPFLERRMRYKRNPSALNKERAQALKWVLVSSYGYLRFREFKLGLAASHMAMCAYARDVLLDVKRLAEERGFRVVHGIVDSLYLKKRGITEDEVKDFCAEVEERTGLPIQFEGIFKWIVFLSSVNDARRPMPARYYGIYRDGSYKARGIELRQRSAPTIVRRFQGAVLDALASCDTPAQIKAVAPRLGAILESTMARVGDIPGEHLARRICIGREEYAHDVAQARIARILKTRGMHVAPGMRFPFVYTRRGPVPLDEYRGNPNLKMYRTMLLRALYVVLQPFGFTRAQIAELSACERQTTLIDFATRVRTLYLPYTGIATRRGLSERILKRRLEREGWTVWRAASIDAHLDEDAYPAVVRKYASLARLFRTHGTDVDLLRSFVYNGIPDFLCYRRGEFKFVECKLEHEPLSAKQRACILSLQRTYTVEVHVLVNDQTKARVAERDLITNERRVFERQKRLTSA